MGTVQWTRAESAHKEKLLESYRQLLADLSSPELQAVGNYSIGRLIGKGSFGKVYLATHRLISGTKVVLKSARRDDPHLAREIHHHRQFVHPHIARLYEVILTESFVWLVLEYCPGDELLSYLADHGRLDPSRVQSIFSQLVGAVTYIHRKRCVHRDLKLENVLLDKHGNVKLVDFGFTREYGGKNSVLQTWCGTICYSAPEMLQGEKYAAEKVDVWSLGVILYALLTGELPFDAEDEAETRRQIVGEEPGYGDFLPPAAVSLLKRLISKRPLLRPSLDDILADPWLADHSGEQIAILARPVPPPFSTEIEHETLLRMRTAGVDVSQLMDNVTGHRCDPLAGWWALLLERETRKAIRREKRQVDRGRRRSIGIDRVVSPLRLDVSRSRRSSRFGSDFMAASPTAVRSGIPTPTKTSMPVPLLMPPAPPPPPPSFVAPTARSAIRHDLQATPTLSPSKASVPEVSVMSAPSVGSPSPSRAPGMPLFGHLKQWLRQTTRRDPVLTTSSPPPPAPAERRRLGFATAGFRLYRDRKRVPSPAKKPMLIAVDPAQPSLLASSISSPSTPAMAGDRSAPGSARPHGRTDLPQSRGRPTSSRLAVPSLATGTVGLANRPTPRQRSTSGSAPLQSHSRRLSSHRGRKSTSSSLSSIRSLRPQPSHSKASSTSSTTTSAGVVLSPAAATSNIGLVTDSFGPGVVLARNARLASPIHPPLMGFRPRKGRSSSTGSGKSTPVVAVTTDSLDSPFPRSNLVTPRARARPSPFVGGRESSPISTAPISPGVVVARRRQSGLGSPLVMGLGLTPALNSGTITFTRGRRRRSGRGAIIVEEDEEEDEGGSAAGSADEVEEVEEFDDLESGEEALYHDIVSSPDLGLLSLKPSPLLKPEPDNLAHSPPESPSDVTMIRIPIDLNQSPSRSAVSENSPLRKLYPNASPRFSSAANNDSGAVLAEEVSPRPSTVITSSAGRA